MSGRSLGRRRAFCCLLEFGWRVEIELMDDGQIDCLFYRHMFGRRVFQF